MAYKIQLKLVLILFCLPLLAGGDAEKGKTLFITCTACHSQNGEGNQTLGGPALAGQEDWYLTRQINNFKQGLRGTNPKDLMGMQMRPMSMLLTDDQAIADVVAHIKTLPEKKPEPKLTGGDPAKGKMLYMICSTCHGPEGKGNQALNAPRLNLQQDWYMKTQLLNFKNGVRGTHANDIFGMQMAPMAQTLADEQAIKDVIAYILTLK